MRKSTAKPRRKKVPKRVLALPDLEQAKAAVLNGIRRDRRLGPKADGGSIPVWSSISNSLILKN